MYLFPSQLLEKIAKKMIACHGYLNNQQSFIREITEKKNGKVTTLTVKKWVFKKKSQKSILSNGKRSYQPKYHMVG